MPQRRDDDPQFPERSGGSLLRTAVASTPLAAGLASSLRTVHQDGSIKQPREAGIDQAMRTLASKARKPRIPSVEDMNRFMRGQTEGVNRQAWKWAVGSVDPFTRKKLLSFTEHMDTMTDPELRSAIVQSMQRNQSLTMERVWKNFASNVRQLERADVLPAFVQVSDLKEFAMKRTIPMVGDMDADLYQDVQRIAKKLGTTVTPRGITTPTLAGEGFGIWNVRFQTELGDIAVSLPEIKGGILHEGAELQTRRIAPDIVVAGEEGLERISRTKFFLKEFEESILPDIGSRLKSQQDVERAVKQLRGKVFGELEAVPAVDPIHRTAAQAQREALRGKAVQVVKPTDVRQGFLEYRPTWKTPTAAEMSEIMASAEGRAMGLRGGIGPGGLTKGLLSTAEWEQFYLGDVDYSRRPEQRFREFQVTEESMRNLGQYDRYQKFKALQMQGDDIAYANVARPKLKAAYVDPERFGSVLEQQAMGEGEAVARASRARMLEFESAKTLKLMEARDDIADLSKLKPGDILGTSPEGKIVSVPEGARVLGARRIPGDALHVDIMQTHQFRHGDKIFGGAKAVTLFRSEKEFGNFVSQIGANDADIIVSMDELRKNRTLHKAQIISSLENMMQAGGPGTGLARRFWAGEGEKIGRAWAATGSHEDFIRKAMQESIGMGLSPKEFGSVFGATPAVLGDYQETAKMIRQAGGSNRYIREATRGVAGGLADIAFGGPRLEAGGMGSIEPRVFDILREGGLGSTGTEVAEDFMQRLSYTNPEAQLAHLQIGKTLESMVGKTTPTGPVWKPGTDFQKFIEAGGGRLSPGQGLPDIHVPGADVMRSLRPFETASGVNVRGKVSDIYHNLAKQVGAFQEGEIGAKEMERQMGFASRELLREAAPGGKGIGSVMRGKMIGSRFLRGVSAMGGAETAMRDERAVGITEQAFESMLREMEESGLYRDQAQRLQQMRDRFLSGKTVGGMVGRHPMIGGFSVQPVAFQRVEGSSDLMVLPEIKQNIRVKTALEGEFKEKTLTLGPLIGMSGDKDADAYSAMLVSPRTEEAIRKEILQKDSEFAGRYAQHQVRMQLFKAGRAQGDKGMSTVAQMIAETEKLRTGQDWIGKLSIELTSAKRALGQRGQGAAAADARFLLEWLEQTPISAKHMSAEKAGGGGLEALMMSITESMRDRNAHRLRGNIETIVKDDAIAKSMLTSDIFMDSQSARQLSEVAGAKIAARSEGINVNAALDELMRVMGESEVTGSARHADLLTGRGANVKMREVAELAAQGAFRAEMPHKGMFSAISSAMTTASNRLGQAGRGILRNHKAIGFGFAGSLALSAILSEPPETVGTARATIPDARVNMNVRKGASRLKPEDVHPPAQPTGSPTISPQMRNQTVRIAQKREVGARVRSSVPAGVDTRRITSGMAGMGKNTSVNLRDNRKQLTSHEIATKLL